MHLPGLKRFLSGLDARDRLLAAAEVEPTIAGAARRAGLHRSTVYRWLADDAVLAGEMRAAWQRRYERWRTEVFEPAQAARAAAKAQRSATRRTQRRR